MPRPRAQIDTVRLADAFADGGLDITADALAAAVGVAKPTLYAHGRSKDSLLRRAVDAEVERTLDRIYAAETAAAGRSARDRAIAIAHSLLRIRPTGLKLLARSADDPAVQRIPARIATTLHRDLVADGLDPKDAPWLARALYGAVQQYAVVHAGELRPARAHLAALAAAAVPAPPAPALEEWPVA